jgi:TatD DNase family protein
VRQVALQVPIDRLMVETDAPYLTPEPYRGKRNEPAYVVRTLEELVQLRGERLEVLAQATAENAWRLFGIGD